MMMTMKKKLFIGKMSLELKKTLIMKCLVWSVALYAAKVELNDTLFTVYSAGRGSAGWCDKSVSGGTCR